MPETPPLVLATGPPCKRRLIKRLAVDFTARPADGDKTRRSDKSPRQTALRLATRKARSVADG